MYSKGSLKARLLTLYLMLMCSDNESFLKRDIDIWVEIYASLHEKMAQSNDEVISLLEVMISTISRSYEGLNNNGIYMVMYNLFLF